MGNGVNVTQIILEINNPTFGYPGMLTVFSAGNSGYFQTTGSAMGTLTLKVGASSSSHHYSNQYGSNYQNYQMAFFSSAGPKSFGFPAVDLAAPAIRGNICS